MKRIGPVLITVLICATLIGLAFWSESLCEVTIEGELGQILDARRGDGFTELIVKDRVIVVQPMSSIHIGIPLTYGHKTNHSWCDDAIYYCINGRCYRG
jgi:hypothetical protein